MTDPIKPNAINPAKNRFIPTLAFDLSDAPIPCPTRQGFQGFEFLNEAPLGEGGGATARGEIKASGVESREGRDIQVLPSQGGPAADIRRVRVSL